MVRIERFRSTWGVEPGENFEAWRPLFAEWKKLGYDYVLERVPELRITGDFSHWIVGCERLLDVGEEDQELLDRVIPHVYHIHTRIGTTQSTQCPEPLNPIFAAERAFFEKLWIRIIKSRAERDVDAVITFVPEYGLFPYHPFGSVRTSAEVADSEGPRLQKLFEDSLGSLEYGESG
ncbi:hypothetical protein CEP52_008264 [Fusarium oligoseptatum]|uniref:Xylose isomerase-like TIM barrel domain-containing protein n=1 Tax=Fusarium oligoseptatum TaxID=2604345 RepID=A0A428TIN3_9HYPO|nr:hypothetical protein CEP52_008264 [Fusarium oligoseptatum]